MQSTQPLIGLLLSQTENDPQTTSLLAKVETIEPLATTSVSQRSSVMRSSSERMAGEGNSTESALNESAVQVENLVESSNNFASVNTNLFAIELSFPESLKRQQQAKIKRLLTILN